MNKQGYTLIELIGVIVILSIMVLLLAGITDKTIKKSEEKTNKQCEQSAIMAAQNWVLDNKNQIENETTIKTEELIKDGYLNDESCLKKSCIIITKNTDGDKAVYNYSVEEKCKKNKSNKKTKNHPK